MGKLLIVTEDGKTVKHRERLEEIMKDVIGADMTKIRICTVSEARTVLMDWGFTTICLVGAEAHKEFSEGAITKVRGVLKTKGDKIIISTFSIGYIEHNPDQLTTICNDLYKAYAKAVGIDIEDSRTAIKYCKTMEDITQLIAYVQQTGVCCLDVETNDIDKLLGASDPDLYITCLSISFQHGSGWSVPLFHKENNVFNEDECYQILEMLKWGVFQNTTVLKIAHNINYEAHVLSNYSIELEGRVSDTMLMHHLIDETKPHGLKSIVSEWLPEFSGYENELSRGKFEDKPLDELSKYNAIDTDVTIRLHTQFESMLLDDDRLYLIYRNLTMPAWRALFEAERYGALIDKPYLKNAVGIAGTYIEEVDAKLRAYKEVIRYENSVREEATEGAIQKAENKLAAWQAAHSNITATETKLKGQIADLKSGKLSASEPVNFNSPKQMQQLLYFHPSGFKFFTFEGDSTGKDIISNLGDESGFIDDFLILKSMSKMRGTYLKGMYNRLDSESRLHTQFLLHGTVSGRLSSRNPNLQNIPNIAKLKDERVIEIVGMIKKSFIPEAGHWLMQLDFSQAELRLMAEFANESAMIEAYNNDVDIHTLTAANIFDLSIDEHHRLSPELQKERRTRAKSVNFGLIYGMGAAGYKEYAKSTYGIEVSLQEAEVIRDTFFRTYPNILEYHERYIDKASKFGWVRTLFGRKRRTPNINISNFLLSSMDERIAVNSPIQGTGGELTLFAIALLRGRLDKRVKLTNTVHDSIIYDVPEELLEETARIAIDTCENAPMKLYFGAELRKVKMHVDVEASENNWKELKPILFGT